MRLPTRPLAALCLLAGLLPAAAAAQGFSALVSPPRFEDRTRPGEVYRNVVEITNVSARAARYTLKTADWSIDGNGAVAFDTALAPGSCRPWVGLEAAQIDVAGNGKRRYRFEVAVPKDAPAGECRFAILLEGEPESVGGALALPVAGRIGIIVYLAVGDAAAKLRLLDTGTAQVDGKRVPVLRVRNEGNAHTRLEGLVDAVDAGGRRYGLQPSSLPILAGETRTVTLTPQGDSADATAPTLAYPLQLKGALEWDRQTLPLDQRLAP
ncbi:MULTISPECIES: hypothetical protein [Bacteria]|uniref:Pili assembly chaperone N-terminal domain-containing protein n=1 Tax=Lysobacter enzymogenes TaxID=69 RepID=A0AAU9AEB0_LYSEN|nr:hypothetical protein [Lysobacter enzymogenes]BAV95545.1 conserved hypothetical protein [Lysobacter enzymogenes]